MNKRRGWLSLLLASGALALAAGIYHWLLAPVVLGLALITFSPLARARRIWFVGDVENEYSDVSRRREEALRALKDLDDDYESGRIPNDEYQRRRAVMLHDTKQLTGKLDEIAKRRKAARDRVEADLQKRTS